MERVAEYYKPFLLNALTKCCHRYVLSLSKTLLPPTSEGWGNRKVIFSVCLSVHTRGGIPPPAARTDVPPSQSGLGSSPWLGWDIPSPGTGYAAGGTPLAVSGGRTSLFRLVLMVELAGIKRPISAINCHHVTVGSIYLHIATSIPMHKQLGSYVRQTSL